MASSASATTSLIEWRIPVSSRLTVSDLTLLASGCRSLNIQCVVFAYRGAAGKPLPEVPTREQLRQIAVHASVARVLARLDLEDITDTVALPKLLTTARDRFDIFSIIVNKDDPLLFERIDVGKELQAVLSAPNSHPLIINVDACTNSSIILPRKRLPAHSVIEISYSSMCGTARNDAIKAIFASQQQQPKPVANPSISTQLASSLRTQLPRFSHLPLLVSCGGDVIGPQEVDAAALCRLRSPVDVAALVEVLCGRAEVLATSRSMSKRIEKNTDTVQAKKTAQQLTVLKEEQHRPLSSVKQAPKPKSKAAAAPTITAAPAPQNFLDSAALAKLIGQHFCPPPPPHSSTAAPKPKHVFATMNRGKSEQVAPALIQESENDSVYRQQLEPKKGKARRRNRSASSSAKKKAVDATGQQQQQQSEPVVEDHHFGWTHE